MNASYQKVLRSTSSAIPRLKNKEELARLTLPRAARLRKGYQYDAVRMHGATRRGALFRMSSLFSSSEKMTACGIIVSRRVGDAVTRNQVKRRLRDLYRHERLTLITPLWIVIVATPQAATATMAELRAEWRLLGKKLSIFHGLTSSI